jgi:hypothetical protein
VCPLLSVIVLVHVCACLQLRAPDLHEGLASCQDERGSGHTYPRCCAYPSWFHGVLYMLLCIEMIGCFRSREEERMDAEDASCSTVHVHVVG